MGAIWQIWQSGGWVMIPLFGVAVLLYAQAFQLVMYVRRSQLAGKQELHWWDWVRQPEKAEGRVAEIIRYTQRDVSTARQIRNRFEEVRLSLLSLIDRRTDREDLIEPLLIHLRPDGVGFDHLPESQNVTFGDQAEPTGGSGSIGIFPQHFSFLKAFNK